MAIMDLVVGATTYSLPLPMQNGYTEELNYRGSAYRMAAGNLVRENTSTTVFHKITIEWVVLTAAQKTIVDNAVAAMIDGTAGTFTNPGNSNLTVVLGDEPLPTWEMRTIKKGTELRYSGRLSLEKSA